MGKLITDNPELLLYTESGFHVKVHELNQVRNIDEENQTAQYFDGLGRLSQVVQLMASPTYKDIVQHIAYDGFGRESRKYLPYAERMSDNGCFKAQASANQQAFYSEGWDAAVVKTPYPYAETVFENSPLNRVLEQGAPGQVWQPVSVRNNVQTSSTSGHTVVTDYGTNAANDVRLWTIDGTGANGSGYYLAGRLYKTVIKDENWGTANGKGGTIEEYKDFEGRVVLKRVWESDSKALHTYYVYDDFGDLRYVISPGYTASSIADNDLSAGSSLVYAYRFDGRRRLIEKKLPGKGWEYFVYNRNDQVILTQDANQRVRNEWLFTKYDAFGRVIITGTYINAGSQSVVQAAAIDLNSSIDKEWETAIATGDGYSNTVFPTAYASCHSINYYDDYAFPGNIFGNPVADQAQGIQTKGLLTASKVATLGTGNMLLTVNYYDVRARLVGVKQQNHLGGTDIITNEYSFVGELTSSKREHKAGVGGTTTMLTKNTYDHVGRLLSANHQVDSQAEVMLAKHLYNEIGQLKEKQIGLDAAGTNPTTTISYAYNPRGWLESASSSIFSQQLFYHTSTGGVTPQYNGNIGRQQWTHKDETTKEFTYTYDKLNRLKDGYSVDAGMREELSYDDMGNITNLKRDGHATGIQYQYVGNQLLSVSNQVQGSYEYDANGNAKRDRMGFKLTYNHLNLPSSVVTSADAPVVSYTYDALGNKLQKISTHATNNRNYVSGIEYKSDNSIDLIHTSEGTAFKTGNAYVYHYNLQDHLGNVRATIRKVGSQAEVLQKDGYSLLVRFLRCS